MDKENLEEITKNEFEDTWKIHISRLRFSYKNSVDSLNNAVEKYNTYLEDERESIIRYYKDEKGKLIYSKKQRDEIGFK